jgi:NADPH:quinone reductase-like Zn-dependent oxidoreductase
VLVKVAAAGVNRPDVMQRKGLYPPPAGATDIPGLEIAGEVVGTGAAVSRWKVGDRVMALVVGGGYAQFCLAHESHALPIPHGLSVIEAAALPETFFTVWHNVFEPPYRQDRADRLGRWRGRGAVKSTQCWIAVGRGWRVSRKLDRAGGALLHPEVVV